VRIGAVRLCLALVLGLLIVPAYVVVPVLFAKLDSTAQAGHLAGDIFHMANTGIVFLITAVLVFWFRMQKSGLTIGRTRWLLLGVVALLVAGNEFAVTPVIMDLKTQISAQVGSYDALSADDPLRKMFGLWHGVSAIVHLLASLCATLLVALGAMRPVESELVNVEQRTESL